MANCSRALLKAALAGCGAIAVIAKALRVGAAGGWQGRLADERRVVSYKGRGRRRVMAVPLRARAVNAQRLVELPGGPGRA